MLPNQSNPYPSQMQGGGGSYSTSQSYVGATNGMGMMQGLQAPLLQPHPSGTTDFSGDISFQTGSNTDPNNPELFKKNLQMAYDGTLRLQNLARAALGGIQNAYRPEYTAAQTKEDIEALDMQLKALLEHFVSSGVGALPLLPLPPSVEGVPNPPASVPSEQQLMFDTQRNIEVSYERLKRAQDSAAVVANLVGGDRDKPPHAGR